MTELTCIQLLERVVQHGTLTSDELKEAWRVLREHGSELTREQTPEEPEDTLTSGPE